MEGFWLSLVLTFWAEMGDKTQLVALAYAARYSARQVLIAISVATALVHLLSVGIGHLVSAWLPIGWVQAISALSFLVFGLWSLRGDEGEGAAKEFQRFPMLFIGVTFFLAELGDKTMLTAVTLATKWPWVSVWLGTTIGMILADGLAIGVGKTVAQRVPEKYIRGVAAALFFGFAIWTALEAYHSFHGTRSL